jgi:hypothetical protein
MGGFLPQYDRMNWMAKSDARRIEAGLDHRSGDPTGGPNKPSWWSRLKRRLRRNRTP